MRLVKPVKSYIRRLWRNFHPEIHYALDYWPDPESYSPEADSAYFRPFSNHLIGWALHPDEKVEVLLKRNNECICTAARIERPDIPHDLTDNTPDGKLPGFFLKLEGKSQAALADLCLTLKTASNEVTIWKSPVISSEVTVPPALTISELRHLEHFQHISGESSQSSITLPTFFERVRKKLNKTYQSRKCLEDLRETLQRENLITTAAPQTFSDQIQSGTTVIVPVFNALSSTMRCIRSILQSEKLSEFEIILVNDSSESHVTEMLRAVTTEFPLLKLVEHEKNLGFIEACYSGMNASMKGNDLLLLNSDVVLAPKTLQKMKEALYARPDIAMCSPLSTASPHMTVKLPGGYTLRQAENYLHKNHTPSFPTVITPEGQCLAIRRSVIEEHGFLDRAYGRGYGEESDLAMKCLAAGHDIVCADNTVISHEKSQSFGEQEANALKKVNRETFQQRWSRLHERAQQLFYLQNPLSLVRDKFASAPPPDLSDYDVIFLVESFNAGGGLQSVLQHANEMYLRGGNPLIVSFQPVTNVPGELLVEPYYVPRERILDLNWQSRAVIATFWTTVAPLLEIRKRFSNVRTHYYVQGYEPWFYAPSLTQTIETIKSTYTAGLTPVVKTYFLRDILQKEHQISAELIAPGIDTETYYPGKQDFSDKTLKLIAFYREDSLWRGDLMTLLLLEELLSEMPELEITLAGKTEHLRSDLQNRITLLPFQTREQVARLYRESHFAVDLSVLHGFGRTGIEAMACGAIPILASSGGIREYARNTENALIFDVSGGVAQAVRSLKECFRNRQQLEKMAHAARATASAYCEYTAVDNWEELLGQPRSDRMASFLQSFHTPPCPPCKSLSNQ